MLRKSIIIILSQFFIGYVYPQDEDSIVSKAIINYLSTTKKDKKVQERRILQLNPNFDYLYNSLKSGKKYSTKVTKGFFEHRFINNKGIEHPALIFIPYKYDPNQKYKVRVFLHGGVNNLDSRQVYSLINRIDTSWQSVNTICLFPSSWIISPWWSYNQYENLSNLLDYIKEVYNTDENNVYLTGVSDGATGIFYLSNFFQTPFSCYLPFIGGMQMLTILTHKQFYLDNYQGLSFFIVNGRKDQIFDINFVIPSISELKKVGQDIRFIVVDSAKHNTRWYPTLKDSINSFIAAHKRNPYPDRINYATEKPDTFGRKFWVRIDKIGMKSKNNDLRDYNQISINGKSIQLFPRNKIFGQIDVSKTGNTVHVLTNGVKRFTLLISPDHFDLEKPITVYTNNVLSFEGLLVKDNGVLLKYFTEDNDRTMLFAGELSIKVGREFKGKK